MKVVYIGMNVNMLDEWNNKFDSKKAIFCYDMDSVNKKIENLKSYIIVADYDTVSSNINTFISSDSLPNNMIVLEREPEITTGKMLISHGVKAYGNSRMLANHYKQMIQTVKSNKIWTYPELTVALADSKHRETLNSDSIKLIKKKLTHKEEKAIYLILEGLTNEAIANKMNITIRTVKAHVSSIFKKLHVNDRLSLVLLLK